MNILQVNSIFHGGGVDSQTLGLCEGLQQLGESVWLAIGEGSTMRAQAVERLPGRVILIDGKKPHWVRRLIGIIRDRQIDLIHAHHGRDYWPSIVAARLSGRRCGVVVSRHLMTTMSRPSRRLLLRFAHVAAVSDAAGNVLEQTLHGPRARLHKVYGGIDIRRFVPASREAAVALRYRFDWPEDCVIFALAAHLNPPRGKGHFEFVEAAHRLSASHPNLRFLIVGDGPLGDAVRAVIRGHGLESQVRILPFCTDVERYLGAIDVLVHPAVGSEALGIVLWEAMACGKPVIGSRLDGIPEAFVDGRHGFLVPPTDVDALTAAMKGLADDQLLRRRMGEAGREYVASHFSQLEYARRSVALYRGVLGEAPFPALGTDAA